MDICGPWIPKPTHDSTSATECWQERASWVRWMGPTWVVGKQGRIGPRRWNQHMFEPRDKYWYVRIQGWKARLTDELNKGPGRGILGAVAGGAKNSRHRRPWNPRGRRIQCLPRSQKGNGFSNVICLSWGSWWIGSGMWRGDGEGGELLDACMRGAGRRLRLGGCRVEPKEKV